MILLKLNLIDAMHNLYIYTAWTIIKLVTAPDEGIN